MSNPEQERSDTLEGDDEGEVIEAVKLPEQEPPRSPSSCKNRLGETPFYRFIPFLVFFALGSFIDSTGSNLALPYMQEDFNISESLVQWAVSITYIATATLAIPLSKLSEQVGQVLMCQIFSVVMLASQMGCAFLKNFYMYLVLKFIFGAASAGIIPSKNAMVRLFVRKENAQKAIMQSTSVMNGCAIVLPIIAGLVIDSNWRILHFIVAGASIVMMLLLFQFENPKHSGQKNKFDILGTILLFFGIAIFDLSFTVISYQKYVVGSVMIVVGLGILVGMIFYEKRVDDPVLPLNLLHNPVLEYVIINVMSNYISGALSYLLPQIFKFNGKSATAASSVQMVQSIVGFTISLFMPLISKKIILKSIMLFGISWQLVFLVLGTICAGNFPATIVCIFMSQIGNQFIVLSLFPTTIMSVPPQYSGQISAIPTTGRTVGQSITYCVTSMVQQMLYQSRKAQDLESDPKAWSFALRINFVISIAMEVGILVLCAVRTGQAASEVHKKRFDPKKVRQLAIMEDRSADQLLKDTKSPE